MDAVEERCEPIYRGAYGDRAHAKLLRDARLDKRLARR